MPKRARSPRGCNAPPPRRSQASILGTGRTTRCRTTRPRSTTRSTSFNCCTSSQQPTRASPTRRRASGSTRSSRRRSSSRRGTSARCASGSRSRQPFRRTPAQARHGDSPSAPAGTRYGWSEPKRPGVYPVHVTAVDSNGNKAAFDALPIVRVVPAKKTPAKMRSTAVAPPPAVAPSFAVGAGLNDPSQGPLAQKAGLHLVRLGITWPAGATTPDPTAIAALAQLPPSLGVVVELNAAPASDRRRRSRCARAVRRGARAAGAEPAVSRPRAGGDDGHRARVRGSARRPAAGGAGAGARRARRSVTRRQRERKGNDHGTRGHLR